MYRKMRANFSKCMRLDYIKRKVCIKFGMNRAIRYRTDVPKNTRAYFSKYIHSKLKCVFKYSKFKKEKRLESVRLYYRNLCAKFGMDQATSI